MRKPRARAVKTQGKEERLRCKSLKSGFQSPNPYLTKDRVRIKFDSKAPHPPSYPRTSLALVMLFRKENQMQNQPYLQLTLHYPVGRRWQGRQGQWTRTGRWKQEKE